MTMLLNEDGGGGGGGGVAKQKRGQIVCEKPFNWSSLLTLVTYWYNDDARLFETFCLLSFL